MATYARGLTSQAVNLTHTTHWSECLMYYVANACSNRNLCNWRVNLDSNLTTAHPYAAWTRDKWLAWATLGHGTGTLNMYDTKHDAHYRGIDIAHTMVAGGVDREHSASDNLRINVGAKGFWSVTRSAYTRVASGLVRAAKAPNLSLESYVEGTLNPDRPVQPSLGIALGYDRDDYETNLRLKPSVGVNVEYRALSGHVEVVLAEGRWDVAGNVMFEPDRGLYVGLTRSAPEPGLLDSEPVPAQLQLETGWKRNGLSPYMALGDGSWKFGQKLGNALHHFDVHVRGGRHGAQLRVGVRIRW